MTRSATEALDKYADAFRDLINEKNMSSRKPVKELLRLNKDEDWGFICAAMDVIEDASSAIANFLRFGLDGPTKYQDEGERYLRLYGVLNATYVQQQAIKKLYELMHDDPNLGAVAWKNLNSLRIREVRNKLGSHSTEYKNRTTKKLESFVPIRICLSGFNCDYLNNQNLRTQHVDLKEALEEHLALMVKLMDQIYEKSVDMLYKCDKNKISDLGAKLKDLRVIRDGGIVIAMPDGPKIIITMGRGNIADQPS